MGWLFGLGSIAAGALTALGGLVTAGVLGLLAFLATKFAKILIIKLLVIAGIVYLSTRLYDSVNLLINDILVDGSLSHLIPEEFAQACSMVVPSNLYHCLIAIGTIKLLIWGWQWQAHFVEMYLNAI